MLGLDGNNWSKNKLLRYGTLVMSMQMAYRIGAALAIGGASGWLVRMWYQNAEWDGAIGGIEMNLAVAAGAAAVAFWGLPHLSPVFKARVQTQLDYMDPAMSAMQYDQSMH